MTETPKSSTWDKIVSAAKWTLHNLLGPVLVIVVTMGAGLLVLLGLKDLKIGGLIGTLLGEKKPTDTAIGVANSIPSDRVDSSGKLIPIGTADATGMTQAAVVPILDLGTFGNHNTVSFTAPGDSEPTEINLPTGVKSGDVEHVVVVQPGKFAVTVKDSSGIPASSIDDLLKKYG